MWVFAGMFSATLFVVIIGYGGYALVDNIPLLWLYLIPVILGMLLYLISFGIFKKLSRVEKVKSEFLTVAAHNLRTPLTKIQWLVSDVSGKIQDQETLIRFKEIQNSLKDLTQIVNRFLEISEAGQTSVYFSYAFETQHIEYVVLQAVSTHKVGIEQKNLALTTRIREGLPAVLADKERIQLVINILVENAIMYNEQNGSIDIELYEEKGDMITCSIKSTGIGIAKENLPKMFTKFYRTQEAISKNTDSIGLGLSLAKEIIKKHGGKIHVESDGKGLGARFWFTLPVAREKK